MFQIGIDVGSTYVKYCIMKGNEIIKLYSEQAPLRQTDYFEKKTQEFLREYPNARIVSCGYGKRNVNMTVAKINELTALARGNYFVTGKDYLILDIGGQDTKIIQTREGVLDSFFINDKCAAGSGMFLTNTLERVGVQFDQIDVTESSSPAEQLSSVCAVFAQSEIVQMIANNKTEEEVVNSVLWQILISAKSLLNKTGSGTIMLSGGLTIIPGFQNFATKALNRECITTRYSDYYSAIGCSLFASELSEDSIS